MTLQIGVINGEPQQRQRLTPGQQHHHQQNRIILALARGQQITPQHPRQQRQKRNLQGQQQGHRYRQAPGQPCQ
ncbi:hypothetical protein D3C85_1047940 [compost metagenome]